jgi:1,4-dihydroxy-2-naphthoyl-CoA hydrolase
VAPESPSEAELTEQVAASMPFARLLGIEMLSAEPGQVRGRVAWDESRTTAGGVLHGGVLMALADACGALCAFANLPDGSTRTATIESKTNFLAPVRSGFVEAVSQPLHVGRTTIVVETDVLDQDGRRVARVTQTQAVLP